MSAKKAIGAIVNNTKEQEKTENLIIEGEEEVLVQLLQGIRLQQLHVGQHRMNNKFRYYTVLTLTLYSY